MHTHMPSAPVASLGDVLFIQYHNYSATHAGIMCSTKATGKAVISMKPYDLVTPYDILYDECLLKINVKNS